MKFYHFFLLKTTADLEKHSYVLTLKEAVRIIVIQVLLLASQTYPSVLSLHLREMEAPNSEDYTLYEGKTESAVTDDLQARILET